MLAVLLPVKEFARSKHRLAGWLSSEERELLARTMFEDVWTMLRAVGAEHRLLVISSEPVVVARCREEGILCRVETEQRSHSDSVMAATAWAMSLGITSLLAVPIDTPAVTTDEISALTDLARRYAVVIVPSADGTGTNALLRTPPDAIAPRFGPGSCRLHAAQAEAKRLPHRVLAVPGLAADIDTPEDAGRFLAFVSASGRCCRTAALLEQFFEARRGVEVCS